MSAFALPAHTQTPNELFDTLMVQMSNAELRITLVAIRKTFGWHKKIEAISLSQFQKLTGLSRNGVLKGIAEAIKRGTMREAGTGERGVKLYELIMRDPNQSVTSSPTEPVKAATSAVSEPVETATSSPTEHTKERKTPKETKAKEQRKLQPQTPSGGESRPNIYQVWESEKGLLTAFIGEKLKSAVEAYSEQWVIDAIHVSSENGKYNNLSYVLGILKRWKTNGRDAPKASVPPADITHSDQDPVRPSEYIVKRKKIA